jgi:hypothetical protein
VEGFDSKQKSKGLGDTIAKFTNFFGIDKLADRVEALLKTNVYPMVIIEKFDGSVYLYRVETLDEAKESPIGYGTKIGCVSTNSMVAILKKYIKK